MSDLSSEQRDSRKPDAALPAVDGKHNRLPLRILIAMCLGAGAGVILGLNASFLGGLGKLLIQLIKALAVPLVFFAILEAIISTYIPRKSVVKLFIIVGINAFCASCIALLIANTLRPGDSLRTFSSAGLKPLENTGLSKIDAASVVSGYIPDSFVRPFLDNNIAGVVILAILCGLAARKIRGNNATPSEQLGFILQCLTQLLLWLVTLIPLAVFGVMAKTVGDYGFAPFKALAFYVLVCLLGLTCQVLFVYLTWIRLVGKIPLSQFFKNSLPALTYAFGTNSSLATLPLTLTTLDNLKISKAASRLGACVGTNLNNDGILLYEALAALLVAQSAGIDLSFSQQCLVIFLSVVAAIGVAGVPEAGIVSLSLVLTTVNLPTELLPLLLTVDWIVARARSVTNTLSDMTVSIALNESA